jgi:aminomethyltransferase
MFIDTYKASGVVLAELAGVPYPEAFDHPLDEYRALTSAAALVDLCHWGTLRLTGADRVRLLNSLTTNDAASLSPGKGCHSSLTTVKGKLVAELFVLRRREDLVVLVSQGDPRAVSDAIEKHIVADDVTVTDLSGDTVVLAVEGPRSREVVWRLFPNVAFPLERLDFVDVDYQGVPVTMVNNSATGEGGYHLIVGAAGAGLIRDHLIQAGRASDMALLGRVAWNVRRVEAGLPWWGVDVTAGENFPKECRLEDVVSYNKGCYLGQETLARMHHRGHPNWLLVGLVPAGELAGIGSKDDLDLARAIPGGAPLFAPDDASKPAGRITSAVFSPKLQTPLLMGYVRTAYAKPRFELALRSGETEGKVVVTPLPVA